MQRSLLFKTLVVIGLTLIIYIPLAMIQATISERMHFRNEAVRSIAADSVSEQTIVGPLLVIPYSDEYEEKEELAGTQLPKTRVIKRRIEKRLIVFPNELQVKGNVETDHRYRGIHKVLVYNSQHAISGDFILPGKEALVPKKPDSRILMGTPFVALSIEDVRGIRNIPQIDWNGTRFEFQQGSSLAGFRNGLHAVLSPIDLKEPVPVKFSFDLGLDGIERIRRGFGFGFALTVLYGVLYGLLQSENNVLVMGSILLFAVLSAIMVATRKLDWYQLGKSNAAPATDAGLT